MTNARIAERILEVVNKYENGNTSASAIAEAIETHEPALEAIARKTRDKLHSLSLKVIEQDVTPFEEETLGFKNSREALNELKNVLGNLK